MLEEQRGYARHRPTLTALDQIFELPNREAVRCVYRSLRRREEILSVESRILENHRTVDQDLVSGIHLPTTYCLYPDIQGHSFLDQIARVLAGSVGGVAPAR